MGSSRSAALSYTFGTCHGVVHEPVVSQSPCEPALAAEAGVIGKRKRMGKAANHNAIPKARQPMKAKRRHPGSATREPSARRAHGHKKTHGPGRNEIRR